jgi:hypothetical protein
VVENPTCRWSWLQCTAYSNEQGFEWDAACKDQSSLPEGFRRCCLHDGLKAGFRTSYDEYMLGSYPRILQERAWSSPIWYQPAVE